MESTFEVFNAQVITALTFGRAARVFSRDVLSDSVNSGGDSFGKIER
jgi:hypothetical protein